jgi:hypothetical protein
MVWEGLSPEGLQFFAKPMTMNAARIRRQFEGTPWAWDPHELRWPIEVAHRLGMKFYAAIVPYNGRAPIQAYLEHGVVPTQRRYPEDTLYVIGDSYQSKFILEHPEYQLVDRQGKRYHYGVLEWAYPEARRYWRSQIELILDRYAVDGIYMDTRTECMSPDFADQFGFNKPVVDEFRRRYGIDILTEDFDLEKWRALRGEYFTQFLREIAQAVHARGKLLHLGTSRGDYIGHPLGNMRLDWRVWLSEKLVDEFHVDEHGWGWGGQGYGYMTDFATGRGLKPYEQAIQEDYGPLCRKSGVKLYFKCLPYRPRPASEPCCHHRATRAGTEPPAGWCERTAALPEFDGTIEKPAVQPW